MKANDTPGLRNMIWKIGGGGVFGSIYMGTGPTIAYLALYILRRF